MAESKRSVWNVLQLGEIQKAEYYYTDLATK